MIDSILKGHHPLFEGDPSTWSQDSKIQKAFRDAAKQYENSLQPEGNYQGRGIVLCGGGKLWPCVWVAVRAIRHHNCNLPIEIWHLGETEYDSKIMGMLSKWGVKFVDAFKFNQQQPSRVLSNPDLCFTKMTDYATMGGWMLKSYSLLHSSFEEVLFLDSDNTPVRDPEYLFESKPYKEFGAYFWPDKYHGDDEEKYKLSPRICNILGVSYEGDFSFDSGMMLVNKRECLKQLHVSLWWNNYAEYTYEIIYGDKDTFNLAWRQTGKSYFFVSKTPINGYGLQQFDHLGNLAFLHRCGAKWTLGENPWLDRQQEDILHAFIQDLKERLQPKSFI